jgi:uncharacterized protein (TIGR03083 family)
MALDRATVLAGIDGELEAFAALIESLCETDMRVPTRCDGWSVADIAGHVIGIVVDVTQGRLDGQGTPAVTNRQARERAGRSASQLGNELTGAAPALSAILASLPEDGWEGPSFSDPQYTLGFAVEAIWFDAYLHGNDIRAALGRPPTRTPGLRAAVHHVAAYLEHSRWQPHTLALDDLERIEIAGGGPEVTGDALAFVLAATGRADPASLGLDPTVNVYAD